MSRIVRWDPFRDMVSMRSQMDQIMNNWLQNSGGWDGDEMSHLRVPLDVSETDEHFTVRASLPGLSPEQIDVSFSDNTLTIKGETTGETVDENEKYHLRERRFGQFTRSITLPVGINADEIEAAYEDGVLTLTLPKAEEIKPRKISIRGNGGQKVVEG